MKITKFSVTPIRKLPDSGFYVAVRAFMILIAFGATGLWLWGIHALMHLTWGLDSVWDAVILWMLFDRVYDFAKKMAHDALGLND